MKIKLNSKEFLNVSTVIAKSIQSKETLEQTTSLQIENDKLIITHFSGTSLFKGAVNIESIEQETTQKQWLVSGVQFKIILSVLQKDQEQEFVEFHIKENDTQFTIKSGTSKLKLPISEMYNTIKEEKLQTLGEVNAIEFLDTLQGLIKLIATDENAQGHPISCLHLFGKQDSLTLMATNTITLSEKILTFDRATDENFVVLIKNTQATLLNSSTFNSDDIITLYNSKNMFGYIDKYGVLCLVSKADLEPLRYEAFKNLVSQDQVVSVHSGHLKYAVDSISRLCNNNSDIILKISEGRLWIENASNDIIEVPKSGVVEDCRMSISRQSFLILMNILSNNVNLCWGKNEGQRLINIQLLDNENNVDEKSFIIISTNNK